MPTLRVPDGEIYCETHGSGYPLMIFAPDGLRSQLAFWRHSPSNASMPGVWMDPMIVLSHQYRVVAMDRRNAGRSRTRINASDDCVTQRKRGSRATVAALAALDSRLRAGLSGEIHVGSFVQHAHPQKRQTRSWPDLFRPSTGSVNTKIDTAEGVDHRAEPGDERPWVKTSCNFATCFPQPNSRGPSPGTDDSGLARYSDSTTVFDSPDSPAACAGMTEWDAVK